MANFEYKNIDEILVTNLPIRGIRVNLEDNDLLDKKPVVPSVDPPPIPTDPFEFHTFLPNGAYVSSLYEIGSWKVDGTAVSLDVHRDMRATKNLPGIYKIVYNFFKNWIGGYNSSVKLFISDISTDRTELKLSLVNPDSADGVYQLKNFVLSYLRPTPSFPTMVLNFGENKIVSIINVAPNVSWNGNINSFFVKLYEPLPEDLDIFFQCWVAEELMKPYIDTVNYIMEEVVVPPNKLKGPNFEVEGDYWLSTETDYKSWNEILSANVQTSQEVLDRYISSSNLPVQLNVDFREFGNFIFYSSAEDRVNNFSYKMELIERYNNELSLLDTYTGSISSNKVKIKGLRDKTISGFDSFEKWLYYETTASNFYTYQNSASITPYPKYLVTGSDYNIATKEGKYKFYTYNSDQVSDWYDNLITLAQDYDLKNYNSLNKAIPEYLREESDNDQFTTFVNMVGQHFDVIYLYTDHILKKNLREEHPKSGLSQDLIYDATRNLGWTLSHGTQAKDLWEYALGVSGSGDPLWTGKTTTNKYLAKTEEERTKEVWRRILNNLPYIYKSKGTARGIKALLAAYGIPQTLLTIREYGGPDNADLGVIPRAEWEKHTYYLNFSGSYPLPTHQQHIQIPWEKVNNADDNWQYPDTLTFRWKMEPNKLYQYTSDPIQTLLQKQSGSKVDWFVTMNKNGTDVERGSIYFYLGNGSTYLTASITDEYFYDDVPLNLMLRRSVSNDSTSSNQIYDFFVKTNKYGKIAVERSASIIISGSVSGSFNQSWSSNGVLYIGSGSNSQTDKILSGSVFELRYWSNPLHESSFDNHVLAPRSYNGNYETSSFYDLQGQWKFWQKFDVAVTTSISSSHPDQTKATFYSSSKFANFYGFDSGAFESIVETYNMEVATLGNNTIYTEKVRIDSGSLVAGLSKDVSSEVSAFDTYSVDSDKLMVAFSPQSVINEDIYEAIGGIALDDYIGDYTNISEGQYPDLKWLAREYWKKYPNKNDFNSYIDLISVFDFSVFDQIRQTLPARSNPILGVVVEPNILERSKVGNIGKNTSGDPNNVFETTELSSNPSPKMDYVSNQTTIQIIGDDSSDGEFEDISGDTDMPVRTIKQVINNKNGILTGSLLDTSVSYNGNKTTLKLNELSPNIEYKNKFTTIDSNQLDANVVYNNKHTIIDSNILDTNIIYNNKYTIIDSSIIDPSISYNNKQASIDSNTIEPSINYNNKNTVIDSKIIDPHISYNNKQTSIDSKTIEPSINYNNKNTVIDSKIIDPSVTYNNKQTSIDSTIIDPSITYNNKQTSIDSKIIDPSVTYNNKQTSIDSNVAETSIKYNNKETLIENTKLKTSFTKNDKQTLIKTDIVQEPSFFITSIGFNVNRGLHNNLYKTFGQFSSLENMGEFTTQPTCVYIRSNVYRTTGSNDIGYGGGWEATPNTELKRNPLSSRIIETRKDNFYNCYYLYYSSSKDISSKNFYSSSLTSSNTTNQELLAMGIQNNRFLGCKLIGPDINVNSENVPGNSPVVQVNKVGSTEIIYNTYVGKGNLITSGI